MNREINKQLALSIITSCYSSGDSYQCGEDDKIAWASFSNDYPLQHGKGWKLVINKKDRTFILPKIAKCYRGQIKEMLS